MDPASIIGLTVAIQQLLTGIYSFSSGVHEAKTEIKQLCGELLVLKAALEHVRFNLEMGHNNSPNFAEDASPLLKPSNFSTPEFKQMISLTSTLLDELLARLQVKDGRFKSSLQRLAWPIMKDDVKRYAAKMQRIASWFMLVTTSDNVYASPQCSCRVFDATEPEYSAVSRESYLKIQSIQLQLQKQQEMQEDKQSLDLKQSIREWLAPCDPYSFYQKFLEVFHKDTGGWFLDRIFNDWIDKGHSSMLWLRGKHHESQDLSNIIGSFLVQLCEANPQLWGILIERYSHAKGSSQHQQLKRLSNADLERLLTNLLDQSSSVILVVDALNEGKEPSKLFEFLERLSQGNNKLRIVISSTEELGNSCTSLKTTVVSIDHDQTSTDIQTYIETWINNQDDLHSLPSGLKAEIKDVLHKKSSGVFRWVQCQLETLSTQRTPNDIRRALRDVPRTLEKTYRDILLRIRDEDVELAKQTLTWIAFAAFALKPLSLRELSEAVIIGDQFVEIDDDKRLLKPEILLRICGSLIRYNPSTTEVTHSHSSVWNFLTSAEICYSDASQFYIEIRDMDNSVIRRCLNYLLQPAFSSGACGDWGLNKRLHDWPLLEYIAGTFIYHLDFVYLGDDSLVELLLQFFSTHSLPYGGNFGAWMEAFNPKTSTNIEQSTPLYYASRFGLLHIVRLILETDGRRTLEMPGGVLGSTPLHVAAWQGHEEVVEELIRAGANAKEKNFAGESGLLWASRFGFEAIAKKLREAGATLHEVEANNGPQPTTRQCDLCNLSH
ncbi:MAG: hypothetical protein Q9214_000505 [Letrouitia sp. 1 TL-2023]